MTHIHNNGDKVFCFVEVPEGKFTFNFVYEVDALESDVGFIGYDETSKGVTDFQFAALVKSGTWHNPKRACDLTEEKESITPLVYDGSDQELIGKLYQCFDDSDFVCSDVCESFTSLLSSIGMKEETTIVLSGKPNQQGFTEHVK